MTYSKICLIYSALTVRTKSVYFNRMSQFMVPTAHAAVVNNDPLNDQCHNYKELFPVTVANILDPLANQNLMRKANT